MERREFKRIPVNIGLTFSYLNYKFSGFAENVSEKGIFFSTQEMFLPHGSLVSVRFHLNKDPLQVDAKVNRLSVKMDPGLNFLLGADVLHPTLEYLNFVSSLAPNA